MGRKSQIPNTVLLGVTLGDLFLLMRFILFIVDFILNPQICQASISETPHFSGF
jgi:hypothetical protein